MNKIKLTNEELNVVLTGLNEMPHRLVAQLINNIITQVKSQQNLETESNDEA